MYELFVPISMLLYFILPITIFFTLTILQVNVYIVVTSLVLSVFLMLIVIGRFIHLREKETIFRIETLVKKMKERDNL